MELWTYKKAKNKIIVDLGLEDETFVKPDELAGYFNEGITEAESEIYALNQDYFLAQYFVPCVAGQKTIQLPHNIYATKIRGIIYNNGSLNYEIDQYRRQQKFLNVALTDQFGLADDYRYLLRNEIVGQAVAEFHPMFRDTAVLAPVSNQFTPIIMSYLRTASRVPLTGEFCNPEVIATTQVTGDSIQTYSGTKNYGNLSKALPGCHPGSIPYVTGDAVQFYAGPGGSIPAPLVESVTYYVIATGGNVIKLATTKQNAISGTAITLTNVGTVFFYIRVMATTKIQEATILDIPEFSMFLIQWGKLRCMNKESDPRFQNESDILINMKKSMIDSLTKGIDDDADEIQPDFTSYQEMS